MIISENKRGPNSKKGLSNSRYSDLVSAIFQLSMPVLVLLPVLLPISYSQSGSIRYQKSFEETEVAKYQGLNAQIQSLVNLRYQIFPGF